MGKEKYICGTCAGEVGASDSICGGCGSQLHDANYVLRATDKELEALVKFMQVMFRSRTISSGMFRYMRNMVRAYGIKDSNGYDLRGRVSKLIGDNHEV